MVSGISMKKISVIKIPVMEIPINKNTAMRIQS